MGPPLSPYKMNKKQNLVTFNLANDCIKCPEQRDVGTIEICPLAACQRGSKKSRDCSVRMGSWKKERMNKWQVERSTNFLLKKKRKDHFQKVAIFRISIFSVSVSYSQIKLNMKYM
jgi:hypothetical protein